MKVPAADELAQPFFGRRFALGISSILVCGLVVSGFCAALDRASRPALEQIEEPATALADQSYFDPETAPRTGDAALRFKGKDLRVVSTEKVKSSDIRMRPAGRDDSGKFTVYQSTESSRAGSFFLKIENGKYLEVHP